MFWTDWGEVPKIEKASMSGDHSTREVIVSEKIFWPNGLTIDYEAQLIYWVDGKLRFIESMDYYGKNRKTILKGSRLDYPYAITTYQKKLYWTDWKQWYVFVLLFSFRKKTIIFLGQFIISTKIQHNHAI